MPSERPKIGTCQSAFYLPTYFNLRSSKSHFTQEFIAQITITKYFALTGSGKNVVNDCLRAIGGHLFWLFMRFYEMHPHWR